MTAASPSHFSPRERTEPKQHEQSVPSGSTDIGLAPPPSTARPFPRTSLPTVPPEVLHLRRCIKERQRTMEYERRQIQRQKRAATAALSNVQPVFDQATHQVARGISHQHLHDIRLLRDPPAAIREVLEAVVTLLGERDTSWPAIRKVMAATTFQQRIFTLAVDSITPRQRASTKRIVDASTSGFRLDVVRRVCKAAADLAAWVLAVLAFSDALERVAPLVNDLRQRHTNLNKLQEDASKELERLKQLDH